MRAYTLALIVVSSVAGAAAPACARHDSPASSSVAPSRAGDIPLPRDTRIVAARVAAGATLASMLRGCKVAETDVAAVVARAASVFDVRKLRTAQPYRLEQADDGLVRRFEYEIDNDRLLRVARPTSEGGLVAEVLPIPKTRTIVAVSGHIGRGASSLFAAMEAAGEAVDLSIGLADIFNGEIDFNIDLQPGDRFELLVEKQFRDDHVFAGYGPILAAEFDNAGRRFRAVRFSPPGGAPGYYDERGVSMRRFFLHSPLKFEPVVTSGFSRARLHPILRELRPHLGVDYRAPIGAPVIAVADGTVVEAGMNGGAGRMVHLRHVNGFETEYLHLSTIAVRVGTHVRQGDLIGRVGMSGLATGPHLDYRLKKNGAFINPLTAQRAMPPADPIPAAERAAFGDVRDHAFARLTDERASTPPAATRPAVSAAANPQR
jgi:murein DD-endopeptidase MepM/ murein hydrolase activator NlpD